jgi:hypothetical protein
MWQRGEGGGGLFAVNGQRAYSDAAPGGRGAVCVRVGACGGRLRLGEPAWRGSQRGEGGLEVTCPGRPAGRRTPPASVDADDRRRHGRVIAAAAAAARLRRRRQFAPPVAVNG